MNNQEYLVGLFSKIFIKFLSGIMMNDLKEVRHYLSDDLYNKYQSMVDDNISNNEIHCYDELNIKSISITSIEYDQTYEIVHASITSRYMDYYADKETLKYKRGVNDHRIEINHDLVFKKLKDVGDRPAVIKCPRCGANIDVNKSGKCDYCGNIYSALNYEYILCEVTNL